MIKTEGSHKKHDITEIDENKHLLWYFSRVLSADFRTAVFRNNHFRKPF